MSLRSVVVLMFFAVSMTISGTIAWMTVVHANERVEYINERLDKKTGRNEEAIKILELRINALELPGSDE